jgi:PAS domain S-box-containing protein/putative nucleotidyltransferase with HDIG domain
LTVLGERKQEDERKKKAQERDEARSRMSLLTRFAVRSSRARAMMVVGVFVVYALAYLPLRAQAGIAAGLLAMLPVGLAGWSLGLRGGLLAALFVMPLHTLLMNLAGYQGWDVILRETNGLGALATVSVGVATGYWSNLTRTLQQQVAERKQAKEALQESEQRFSVLSAAAFEGIVISDRGQIIDANEQLAAMLGYERSEMMGLTVENFVAPESLELVLQHMRSGSEEPYEHLSLRKDGSTFPVEIRAKSLPYKGRIVRVTAIRNITERKRVEEALHLQSAALEAAANGIVITDREGSIQWANPAFTRLTGFTLAEALGKNPRDLIRSGKQDKAFYKKMWDTILAGRVWHGELINRRKDGTLYSEEMTLTPLKDEHGEIIRFIGIKQDVSERVQADRTIRDSQARLASIIDSAMDAIISLDADQRIILFNRAAEQMFHCPADEVIGQTLDRFVPERFREGHGKHIRKFGQTNQANRSMSTLGSLTCMRADGEEFPAEISISQIELAGEKIYTAILRDVTERLHAEGAMNRRVDELTALYQTTLDIISPHNLPDLLNTIVTRAVDLLQGTSGGMYLCNPEQGQVHCVVSYKTRSDFTGTVLAYGEGAAGIVAATGKPIIINDYHTWEGRAEAFEEGQPFSAVISAPMLWNEQVTGVIHVLHDTEVNKFTREDLKLLTSIANQAAVAVENARLLEETQRGLKQVAALHAIDLAINASLDLRTILNVLLKHVESLLDADAADILLFYPHLGQFQFSAGRGFRTDDIQRAYVRSGTSFAGQAAIERKTVFVSTDLATQTDAETSVIYRKEGFVAYAGVPLIAKGQIKGVLEVYHRSVHRPDSEWLKLLETLAGQAAIAIDNAQLFDNLQQSNIELALAYDATIAGWSRAMDLRDKETEGHTQRVTELTLKLARSMRISESELAQIRRGALLHDIGKMGVPDNILLKADQLTDKEWQKMRQHPVWAFEMLSSIRYLQPALDIPYCHHEKWDGTGYPRGLKGEQIPIAARIFAVADVWDAITSDRPYRKGWSEEAALKYIEEQSGKYFDPKVVQEFFRLIHEDRHRL